jgi:galactose-1-phosphate uridylyltransferase
MKKLRNIKPGQRKRERREQAAALESQAAAFLDHTKECCLCKKEFIRTQETVTTWQVMVREDTVRLTCPSCWELVQTEVEKRT